MLRGWQVLLKGQHEEILAGSSWQETLLADEDQTPVGELVRLVRTQSLTRARYLLRAYLRMRLLKLERFCVSVLNDPDKPDELSPAERQYVQARTGRPCLSPAPRKRWQAAWQVQSRESVGRLTRCQHLAQMRSSRCMLATHMLCDLR